MVKLSILFIQIITKPTITYEQNIIFTQVHKQYITNKKLHEGRTKIATIYHNAKLKQTPHQKLTTAFTYLNSHIYHTNLPNHNTKYFIYNYTTKSIR